MYIVFPAVYPCISMAIPFLFAYHHLIAYHFFIIAVSREYTSWFFSAALFLFYY